MSVASVSATIRGRLSPGLARSLSIAALALVALIVAQRTGAKHLAPLPWVLRGTLGAALLFAVTGAAAAARLAPPALRPIWPVLVLPAGAVLGGLALTMLGFAAVPLSVSLWVVLAAGVVAWLRLARGRAPAIDWGALAPWAVAGALTFAIALIPAWREAAVTIYGDNPDSHQVVGSAVLFQHAPAWGTDVRLPVDTVPPNWRFRYPILYALAGASNMSHFDPIRVFPSLSGLLVALAALGFGALAVCVLRLPLGAGPWVAMATALNAVVLHVAWHPYYNQLWGLALLPWTLLLGWLAVRDRSRATAATFAGLLVLLGLAYSLAVLYPLVLVAGLMWAHRVRPPRLRRPHGWALAGAVLAGLLLAIPLAGALLKAAVGIRQLLTPGAALWGGDVFRFFDLDVFVGARGGWVAALAVLVVAAVTARRLLAGRELSALGALLAVSAAFDVRVRLSDQGAYMDFKHLTFVGAIVLAFAAAGVAALVLSRRRVLAAAGAALALLWFAGAISRIRAEAGPTLQQVTADMFELRDWSRELPRGATIRIDVPPSGVQLWAMYMLAEHRVSAAVPLLHTTYARPPVSIRADYSLAPRYVPGRGRLPWGSTPYAEEPPVRQNPTFVLRRLHVPARFPDRSSLAMVQP